ncbi:M56 family metallopeptidase [Dysgonomonas sp. Marseille-P4677]|uniref:M56 family metallopeptidase n=1 Tax=Dysgonomonas sp. Marseille-P4677 TaxID=2364790 RepID=UPI001911CDA7|nr:M56 family metallopeptidase [Dysgonomonas sp. Marseille-P4677]MBK5722443.1 M56 family metallopeptidase [Dysgonomonas sp. Marseille-P4677]
MDNTIIAYLIKASVALGLFYGVYILCLKKDTFLKLRRFFFLFAILFSLLFSLFNVEIPMTEESVQIPTYWLSDIELSDVSVDGSAEKPLSGWTVALLLLSTVSVFFACRFLIQLFSIFKLRISNESEKISEFRIIKMKEVKTSPFSFFHWIFINSETGTSVELAEIIAHEQIHVKQYHSIDVVLSEILCVFFWWNPFVWLLKNEMKINLEYLADKGVLDAGFDTKAYQYILLQVSNKNTGIPLINNFNVSQLKKRITMMNRKKSSIFLSVKYLLIVPVGVALILGNAVQASSDLMGIIAQNESLVEEYITEGQQVPQKKDGVFVTVDKMPMYPGGESAMHKFINENMKYPVAAQTAGIQGRVIVRFIVKSTGDLSDIIIIRGVEKQLDDEAIRVIKAMPKWNPGQQKGKDVDVYYTLPFVFRLAGAKKMKESGSSNETVVVGYGTQNDKKSAVGVASLQEAKSGEVPDHAFVTVEDMPMFPGGESAMHAFISENLKYPVAAQTAGIQGRVTVRFIVSKIGEISDVNVIRGVDPALDAEAVRVVKAMPNWTPGKQNGIDVPVYFTLPIVYRLKGKTDNRPNLFVSGEKIITESEYKEMVSEAKSDPNAMMVEIVLNDAEAIKIYGEKARGKRVIDVKKVKK